MSELPIPLPARAATAEAIAPYGTLVEPGEDGTPFGPGDAALDLGRGTPRLYVMRLHGRPMLVRGITRHRRVTQCLASATGRDWFVALVPAGDADDDAARPDPAGLAAFRIPGGTALALHRGTWHAGPFFEGETADFLNLELSDTNEVDHHTASLPAAYRIVV